MRCLPKIVCYLVAPILLVLVLFFPNNIISTDPIHHLALAKQSTQRRRIQGETKRDATRDGPTPVHTTNERTSRRQREASERAAWGAARCWPRRGAPGRPRPRRRRRRRWTWPAAPVPAQAAAAGTSPSPSRSSPSPSPTSSTSSPSGASFPSLLQLDLTRPDAIPPPSSPWLGVGARLLGLYDCLWFTKRRIMRVSFLRHRICECRFAI